MIIKDTLQKRVLKELGEDVSLPSDTAQKLNYCSRDLALVKTKDDFDDVIKKYSLLDNQLKRAGLSNTDFKEILEKLEESMGKIYKW